MTVPSLDEQLRGALAELRAAKTVAIVSHRDPDPDTIGSAIALGLALETLGKRVTLHCADPVPDGARFLTNADKVQATPPATDVDLVVTGTSITMPRTTTSRTSTWWTSRRPRPRSSSPA